MTSSRWFSHYSNVIYRASRSHHGLRTLGMVRLPHSWVPATVTLLLLLNCPIVTQRVWLSWYGDSDLLIGLSDWRHLLWAPGECSATILQHAQMWISSWVFSKASYPPSTASPAYSHSLWRSKHFIIRKTPMWFISLPSDFHYKWLGINGSFFCCHLTAA